MPSKKKSVKKLISNKSQLKMKRKKMLFNPHIFQHVKVWWVVGAAIIFLTLTTMVVGYQGYGPLSTLFAIPSVNLMTEDTGNGTIVTQTPLQAKTGGATVRNKKTGKKKNITAKDVKVATQIIQNNNPGITAQQAQEQASQQLLNDTITQVITNPVSGGKPQNAPNPVPPNPEAACATVGGSVTTGSCNTGTQVEKKVIWSHCPDAAGGCTGVAKCCIDASAIVKKGNEECAKRNIWDPDTGIQKPATGTSCTSQSAGKLCIRPTVKDKSGKEYYNGIVSCTTTTVAKQWGVVGPEVVKETSNGSCCF